MLTFKTWKCSFIIRNALDRTLTLTDSKISYGSKSESFSEIRPGETKKFTVKSGPWDPWGIEYYLTLEDKAGYGEIPYGSIKLGANIPTGSSSNKGTLEVSGNLQCSGWDGNIGKGLHDFTGSITVSKKI